MDALFSPLTSFTVNGFPLWVILLICVGVFLASFMDAIAGGGGIISVPTYLMAFHNIPTYYALGTNKLSSGIGTIFSTARFTMPLAVPRQPAWTAATTRRSGS